MLILIPWKPLVVAWCALVAMLWVGYVGYSVVEGKNPFATHQRHSHHLHAHNIPEDGIQAKSNPK